MVSPPDVNQTYCGVLLPDVVLSCCPGSLSLSLSLPSSVHSCTNVPLGSTLSVKDYKGSMIGLDREVNEAIRQEFFTVCVWCVCVCVCVCVCMHVCVCVCEIERAHVSAPHTL